MADDITRQIDRAYNVADSIADAMDSFLGVADSRRKAKASPAIADDKVLATVTAQAPQVTQVAAPRLPVAQAKAPIALPAATGVAAPSFQIVEAIGEDGQTVYVVTNGKHNAECVTRAFADQVLAALAAPLTKGTR